MRRRAEAVPRGIYLGTPVYVAKAEGAVLEDVDGNRYLDLAGGIGCLNVGHAHQITPGDFVGVIAGVTHLPKEVIGRIEILDRETLVDVSDECANVVLKKLNGIKFKGRRLSVDVAR